MSRLFLSIQEERAAGSASKLTVPSEALVKSSYEDLRATFPVLSTQKSKTWEVRVDGVPYWTAVALSAAGCLSSQALPPISALPLDFSFQSPGGGELYFHLPGVTKQASEQLQVGYLIIWVGKKNPLKLSNCHLKVTLRNVCLSITEETSTTKTISHINSLPGVFGLFLNYIPFKRNSQRLPDPFFLQNFGLSLPLEQDISITRTEHKWLPSLHLSCLH